jgi:hypothetical protein
MGNSKSIMSRPNTPTTNNISKICDSKMSLQECEKKISERPSMDDLYNSLKNTLKEPTDIELNKPYWVPLDRTKRINTQRVYIDGQLMFTECMT